MQTSICASEPGGYGVTEVTIADGDFRDQRKQFVLCNRQLKKRHYFLWDPFQRWSSPLPSHGSSFMRSRRPPNADERLIDDRRVHRHPMLALCCDWIEWQRQTAQRQCRGGHYISQPLSPTCFKSFLSGR